MTWKILMNIWYAHHYAGSKLEATYGRPYNLAKSLAEKGNNCRIIAASFHHLMRAPVVQNNSVHSEKLDGINFTWLKTPEYQGNGLKRIMNMISFGYRFRTLDLLNEYEIEKPDAIIISSAHPFHIIGGIHWAKRYKAKLIFEVRDIWPLSLIQLLGISSFHPLSLILSWFEKKAYKQADAVVSLLPNAKTHMTELGLKSDKFNYIPNGIDAQTFENTQPSSYRDIIGELKNEGKFIFMYTGAHGIPNALVPLIKAAELIQQKGDKNIEFVLIGDGSCKQDLQNYAQNHQINNIHFLDAIPRAEIPDTLNFADLVFIGGRNLPLYKFGVSPNKMFEYMLAGKPILMTISSPNNPLELAQAGTCIGSNDPIIIANTVLQYANRPRSDMEVIGERGLEYVKKHHLYNILAQQYIDVIEKIPLNSQ